jgi:hypothetical protein
MEFASHFFIRFSTYMTGMIPVAFPRQSFHLLPMRVLIMRGVEGVSGIVVWEQVEGGKPLCEECRKLCTGEINADVRGAKAAGSSIPSPPNSSPPLEWVSHHPWGRYTGLLVTGAVKRGLSLLRPQQTSHARAPVD